MKKKVKMETFAELAEKIEKGYRGKVFNSEGSERPSSTIDHSDFKAGGYNTIEIEAPKTDRQKCCDLIHNNKWVKLGERIYSTVLFSVGDQYVYKHGSTYGTHSVFIIDFKPITDEERIKLNEGVE